MWFALGYTVCIKVYNLMVLETLEIRDYLLPFCMSPAQSYLLQRATQLQWGGHVVLMPNIHLPKRLFYGEHAQSKHSHGGQKK